MERCLKLKRVGELEQRAFERGEAPMQAGGGGGVGGGGGAALLRKTLCGDTRQRSRAFRGIRNMMQVFGSNTHALQHLNWGVELRLEVGGARSQPSCHRHCNIVTDNRFRVGRCCLAQTAAACPHGAHPLQRDSSCFAHLSRSVAGAIMLSDLKEPVN